MVLPVLVLMWAAGVLQDAKQSTRAVTAAFYICMFVRHPKARASSVVILLARDTKVPHEGASLHFTWTKKTGADYRWISS